MKKIVIKTAAALLMFVLPALSASGGSVTYTATYNSSPVIGTRTLGGVTYTTVAYPGLPNNIETGVPSLPIELIRFSVPWNAAKFSVTVSSPETASIPISYPVSPFQSPSATIDPVQLDTTAYHPGRVFPVQQAWVVNDGMLAGENHIVTIAVQPISYLPSIGNAASDSIMLTQTMTITLNYELSDHCSFTPISRRNTSLRAKGYDLVRSRVINPDDVLSNAFGQSDSHLLGIYPPIPVDTVETPATFLIVATDENIHSLRRLAALRRQKGINVKVVTWGQAINDSLAGEGDLIDYAEPFIDYYDDAGKLRQYLKMHYYYLGTEYALLAGTQVPKRARHEGYADMYFCDMNGAWRYRWDNYAELYTGRLLGSEAKQFDYYTDKLLRYELNPGYGDRSYLQKALLTRTEQYEDLDGLTDWLQLPNKTYLFDRAQSYHPTGSDVIDSISSSHYGFWGSFNPGAPSHIVTGIANGNAPYYLWAIDSVKVTPDYYFTDEETGNGLNCMNNKEYPMICFSGVGMTMPYTTVTGYDIATNFGESFTMGKDYGGPVYMGCTSNYTGIEQLFFSLYFASGINSSNTLGEAYLLAKPYTSSHYYEDFLPGIHNYLGDPMIVMWTDIPETYSGISVSRTDNSITVEGLSVGSKVACCSNDLKVDLTTSTASTVNFCDVDPNSTIMVYDRSHIPFLAPLVLQNTRLDNSQYVIADEVKAGRAVDTGRTLGVVSVCDGASYEIEASGEVEISGGFSVEKGSSFAVYRSSFK